MHEHGMCVLLWILLFDFTKFYISNFILKVFLSYMREYCLRNMDISRWVCGRIGAKFSLVAELLIQPPLFQLCRVSLRQLHASLTSPTITARAVQPDGGSDGRMEKQCGLPGLTVVVQSYHVMEDVGNTYSSFAVYVHFSQRAISLWPWPWLLAPSVDTSSLQFRRSWTPKLVCFWFRVK